MRTNREIEKLLEEVKSEGESISLEKKQKLRFLLQDVQSKQVTSSALYSAIHLFGEAGFKEAEGNVLEHLHHPDPEIRKIALNVLGVHWDEKKHRDVFLTFLNESDEDEEVRAMAASCLGYTHRSTKDRHVIRHLHRVWNDVTQPSIIRDATRTAMLDIWGMTLPMRMRAKLSGQPINELAIINEIEQIL